LTVGNNVVLGNVGVMSLGLNGNVCKNVEYRWEFVGEPIFERLRR